MPAWEYKTVVRSAQEMLNEEQLNTMGANGFELLQVLHIAESLMVVGRRETVNRVHYFFKRARPAQPQAAKAPASAAPRPPAS